MLRHWLEVRTYGEPEYVSLGHPVGGMTCYSVGRGKVSPLRDKGMGLGGNYTKKGDKYLPEWIR